MSPRRKTAPPTQKHSRSSSSGRKELIAKEDQKQSVKKRTVLDNRFFGVRPGTWVTHQTGHIGYTWRLSLPARRAIFGPLIGRFRGASALIQVARGALSTPRWIFDHAGNQLTMRRALSRVSVA